METSVLIRQGKLSSIFKDRSIEEVYVKHYGGFLKGFKGVFILESSPWMLQFIYDFGLGVRTGQGFGLLELISEL
ncbi:MAG: CRISPR-associated endoribonuclease Cas6 [Candidatus Hydrothermales bacterium]